MNIHFILVEPATSGNIGASARAIKTMGFTSLRLIRPADHLEKEAKKFAYGSHDILESAQVFASLEEALADVDLSIGTTAKDRTVWYDYLTPSECIHLVKEKGEALGSVGIVFGSEENGLSKEEMELCDVRSTIPMAKLYPSLNLGQCVMLYAYEFSAFTLPAELKAIELPDKTEQKILKEHARNMIGLLEIDQNTNLSRRMMERLMLVNKDDLHLLLSFHKHLSKKLSEDD